MVGLEETLVVTVFYQSINYCLFEVRTLISHLVFPLFP